MATTGSWNTQDVRPQNKPQQKTAKRVTFEKPFSAPPRLPIGFNSLELSNDANIRAEASVEGITKEGFVGNLDTWGDSILYSAGASWLELSPGSLEYQSGEFSTEDDHPWDEPQLQTSRHIKFTHPFVTPPKVIVFLRKLDMHKDKNWRIVTNASDIDANGFTIHINTWSDSILYSAVAGWVAYPEDRPYVFSATARIEDIYPRGKHQPKNSKEIGFGGAKFWEAPNVFMAINSLDFNCTKDLRIRVQAKDVTPTGLTWHMDSWDDSIFNSAGVSILALGMPHRPVSLGTWTAGAIPSYTLLGFLSSLWFLSSLCGLV